MQTTAAVQKAFEAVRDEGNSFAARIKELTAQAMAERRRLNDAEMTARQATSDLAVQRRHVARLEARLQEAADVAEGQQNRLHRDVAALKV